ncbi:MAG: biotin--[acetyl-CoA-carboxylase] ligase [Candidatus Eisenbacteria bacterium]|nr:biotin--[acetyl-CoA-carboxylase] ligase [Candidatus Eisenbacteria bacterium]
MSESSRPQGAGARSPNRLGHVEPLSQEALARLCRGSRLVTRALWIDETDSTQEELRRHGTGEAAQAGLLVAAGAQTAGRGRLGRSWFSPRGQGLWFSLLLVPPRERREWPFVTQIAALALRRALMDAAALSTQIKWPNDLLCEGRKLAGILAETVSCGPMALGVGVNLGQKREDFPAELREKASSVLVETGCTVGPARLLQAFLARFEADLERFEREGAPAFREELQAASALFGRWIRMSDGRAGRARDVGASGTLELEGAGGERFEIASGEIVEIDPPLGKRNRES